MDRKQERLIEWACQKVMRNYYKHVDQYEYEEAAALFTEDASWAVMGVDLKGRDQILKGLYAGLQKGTIRHILTNTVVTVIDEDHAEARSYNNIYYSPRGRLDEVDGSLPFDGPKLDEPGVPPRRTCSHIGAQPLLYGAQLLVHRLPSR